MIRNVRLSPEVAYATHGGIWVCEIVGATRFELATSRSRTVRFTANQTDTYSGWSGTSPLSRGRSILRVLFSVPRPAAQCRGRTLFAVGCTHPTYAGGRTDVRGWRFPRPNHGLTTRGHLIATPDGDLKLSENATFVAVHPLANPGTTVPPAISCVLRIEIDQVHWKSL